MSISSDIAAHIDSVKNMADSFSTSLQSLVNTVRSETQVFLNVDNIPVITDPKVVVDPVYKPSGSGEVVYANDFNQTFNLLKPYLDTLRDDWLTRFFPTAYDCISEESDTWLCNVIKNGSHGLPDAVVDQIWLRDRSRITREAKQAEDTLLTSFAARGFSIPPGALVAGVLEIKRVELEQSGASSREAAITAWTTAVENARFAIGQATQLRLGVQQALDGYLRTYMTVPQTAVDKAGQVVRAQSQLSDSIAAYYNAIINAAALSVNVQKYNADSTLNSQAQFLNSVVSNASARGTAATATAAYVAHALAGAMSSLGTLSHIYEGTSGS